MAGVDHVALLLEWRWLGSTASRYFRRETKRDKSEARLYVDRRTPIALSIWLVVPLSELD